MPGRLQRSIAPHYRRISARAIWHSYRNQVLQCIAISSLKRFDFSYLISLGNEAVTDIADYLDYIAEDEDTRVAALFVESVAKPRKLALAVAKMRKPLKPVMALKVGRTSSGAAAERGLYRRSWRPPENALLAPFAAHQVAYPRRRLRRIDESCTLLLRSKKCTGREWGCDPQCQGRRTCDDLRHIAERSQIVLPELAPDTIERLRQILPSFATPRNPLDATGTAVFDTEMYSGCLRALARRSLDWAGCRVAGLPRVNGRRSSRNLSSSRCRRRAGQPNNR